MLFPQMTPLCIVFVLSAVGSVVIRTVGPVYVLAGHNPRSLLRGRDKMTGTDENTPLLDPERASDRRLSRLIQKDDAASSIVKSHASVDEQALSGSTVGERLAYNDYTTIDWLHDLVSFAFPISSPAPLW
jgi:hypothetical protein